MMGLLRWALGVRACSAPGGAPPAGGRVGGRSRIVRKVRLSALAASPGPRAPMSSAAAVVLSCP